MAGAGYDAVHVHLGYKGAVALLCAKNCGIYTRISHAHIANEPESVVQMLFRKGMSTVVKMLSTSLIGCGVDAAKWVWGTNTYDRGRVTIMNNAIDTAKYAFSPQVRDEVRKELGIDKKTFVVGHIGRLSAQKNQLRLLDIFKKIVEIRPDSILLLIGRGELENEIRRKVERLGLRDHVRLMGVRDDVPRLLNVMDVFVFPSTHEGLPFTLIETQCNGLPAISANTVTSMVKIGNCVQFLPLEQSDLVWAETALRVSQDGHSSDEYKRVAAAGYDINVEADKLKKYYYKAVEAHKR